MHEIQFQGLSPINTSREKRLLNIQLGKGANLTTNDLLWTSNIIMSCWVQKLTNLKKIERKKQLYQLKQNFWLYITMGLEISVALLYTKKHKFCLSWLGCYFHFIFKSLYLFLHPAKHYPMQSQVLPSTNENEVKQSNNNHTENNNFYPKKKESFVR